MFDALIQDVENRLGLQGKGRELVQMVLAYVADPTSGGVAGFLEKFRAAGLGSVVQSWLGATVEPESPTPSQLESVLGSAGGLIPSLVSRLNLSRETVTSALAFVVPQLISRLTPSGAVPTVLPAEATALIGDGALLGGAASALGAGAAAAAPAVPVPPAVPLPPAVPVPPPASGGGLGKWLPWAIVAAVVLGGLAYCGKKPGGGDTPPAASTAPAPEAPKASIGPSSSSPPAAAPAPEPVPAPAPAPAPAAGAADAGQVPAAPQGAAVVAAVAHEIPMLQVFFDSGKTEVAAEFADKSKALVAYLQSHGDAKAVVSGFNDPTGDPAKNAELSKQRAQAVQAALVSAGAAQAQTVLEKPADATAGAGSDAAARRVDVTVRSQ
ncbi:MAG: YidB family protein [Comamonas sp.]